jgi:hypothetical protein
LREEAARIGFAACGITTAQDDPARAARLHAWLGEGRHGTMDWMETRAEQRQGPQSLWPEARSVIALGMSYAPAHDPLALADVADRARISVYAQGVDYHDLVKRALKALARWIVAQEPQAQVKVFVDTAPVMEKPLGEAAGLGWQGKHTNMVSRRHGSWLFLGAIYTTLDLAPDAPTPTAAARARPVRMPARREPSPRPTSSTRGPAFPTSPSSTRDRSPNAIARRWATGSMAATIASRSAHGTRSPARPTTTTPSCPAPNSSRRASPNCSRSTTRPSARSSQAPHQADRPQPLRAQLPLRGGEQRR